MSGADAVRYMSVRPWVRDGGRARTGGDGVRRTGMLTVLLGVCVAGWAFQDGPQSFGLLQGALSARAHAIDRSSSTIPAESLLFPRSTPTAKVRFRPTSAAPCHSYPDAIPAIVPV